jgi:hypothetical protein
MCFCRHSLLAGYETRATRNAYNNSIVEQTKEKMSRLLVPLLSDGLRINLNHFITVQSFLLQEFRYSTLVTKCRESGYIWRLNKSPLAENFKQVLDKAGLNSTPAETEWPGLKDSVKRKVLAEHGLSPGGTSVWESVLQTATEEFSNI